MTTRQKITRRTVLKSTLSLGASLLAAPAFVRSAFSSSGELNVMMWPDYLSNNLIGDFMEATGIKVNLTEVASNTSILEKVQKTEGAFDLICPTHNQYTAWQSAELLQPFDLAKVQTENLIKPFVDFADSAWNFDDAGMHWLPLVWGAEAMAWRTDKWKPEGGQASYADLWSAENQGYAMGRAFSLMTAAGLVLEQEGSIDNGAVWAGYNDEEAMRKTWRVITDWCLERKGALHSLWRNAEDQVAGLKGDVSVAQTWDGTAFGLKSTGQPVIFKAPKEGALVWSDGLAMPKSAVNLEQAYAFMSFISEKTHAAGAMADHGYNSAVMGASELGPEDQAANFTEAYTSDDLDNLQIWPATSDWYKTARGEFVKEFSVA